jgi:hypothetical protein
VTELAWYDWAVRTELALAVITGVILLFVAAPYGRYERAGWGPTLPATIGWIVMELPAVVLFTAIFFSGDHRFELAPVVLLSLWQVHYLNRTFVFPFRMRAPERRMPVLVMLLGVGFNVLNAYVNARWIGHLGSYRSLWLTDPRFLVGATLFLAGWFGNLHADAILRNLRKPGDGGYAVPRGGLFRWVSAPNYLCHRVDRVGCRHLVDGRSRIRAVHSGQPRAASAATPRLVSRALCGLPLRAEGPHPAPAVERQGGGRPSSTLPPSAAEMVVTRALDPSPSP